MSAFQDHSSTSVAQGADSARGSSGLAIASLVTGILGVCVPLLGLVGVGLGVWALVRRPGAGRGFAIAGIATGGAGLLLSTCMLGLMLPALAKARDTARTVKSGIQMSQLAHELSARDDSLEALGKDGNLKAGDNIESFLAERGVALLFVSPRGDAAAPGYVYVILEDVDTFDPEVPLLIEDPNLSAVKLNVVYGDAECELLDRADFHAMVRDILASGGRLFHTDGRPWQSSGAASAP
jgi:hypothetical protein